MQMLGGYVWVPVYLRLSSMQIGSGLEAEQDGVGQAENGLVVCQGWEGTLVISGKCDPMSLA